MYLYAAILRLADMEAYLLIPIGLQLFILSVLPGMPCFHRHHRCVQYCCVRPNSLLSFTLHVVSVPQPMSWAWFCPSHRGRSSDTQPCAEWPGRSAAYHFHLRWSVCAVRRNSPFQKLWVFLPVYEMSFLSTRKEAKFLGSC